MLKYIFYCTKLVSLLCVVKLLTSCSGYKVVSRENPFTSYGIKSISIPTFQNYSVFPGVSGLFTTEIIKELSRYYGLNIYLGENPKADSILIGIISSPEKRKNAKRNLSPRFISNSSGQSSSIGARTPFYLRQSTSYVLDVTLILIKDPSFELKKLAKSDLNQLIKNHPKIIFSEKISLNGSYSNTLNSNLGPDDGGVVNGTQTRGVVRQSLEQLAKNAARNFRGEIVNVF